MTDRTEHLKSLGSERTEYDLDNPRFETLETFENRFPERNYWVTHLTSEFTSLCPKTGQPDFATIKIEFIPDKLCVESKSLKLYLFSYRGEGSFMETICNRITTDLFELMSPRELKVTMMFKPRGGIETTVNTLVYSKEVQ